jgi:hypothetical protein
MKLFRSKTKPAGTAPGLPARGEALACRPVRNANIIEEHLSDGRIQLSYPTTLKPWFGNWAQRLGKWDGRPMTKKLELDEMGALAWSMINGESTVQDIVRAFSREYGLQSREAELSVTTFIKELGLRGLVGLR